MSLKWLLIIAGAILLVSILLFTGVTITTAVIWDEGKPIQMIDVSSMKQLRQGEITVYFYPQHKALAEEVAQALEQSWQVILRRLHIDLGSFGIALVAREAEELGGVYIRQTSGLLLPPAPPLPFLFPSGLQSLKGANISTLEDVYWVFPHEAMENLIGNKLYHDRQARWLGDGLAEYAGYIITSELAREAWESMLKGRRKNIQTLLEQGHKSYDLITKFPVKLEFFSFGKSVLSPESLTQEEIAGYGVTLAFWLQIAQRHGEEVIRAFWERVSKQARPSAKDAARILSELTGEDIWSRLQNMDLEEVLQILSPKAP